MEIKPIAHIRTDFPEKFGIPRQSGLAPTLRGRIVFEPSFRNSDAVRGLESFSHIWLIWEFSKNLRDGWSPTVRPPKIGGNKRMGVFATRSPFRPNPIGLSCVKLERIEFFKEYGPVLCVSGVDLMNDTPIYDIKPYLPYSDCYVDATGGFTDKLSLEKLEVYIPKNEIIKLPETKIEALKKVLMQDIRPSYQHSSERIYGFEFAGFEVKFRVEESRVVVINIQKI